MWPFLLSAGMTLLWGIAYGLLLRRDKSREGPVVPLTWLFAVLPFCSGGYYAFLSIPTGALLLAVLLRCRHDRGSLQLTFSSGALAVGALALFYLLTPLWAVDRGMAPFGFVQFFPVPLLALALMQISREEKMTLLDGIPLAGCVMTLVSTPMMFIPALSSIVAPDGRLAGFMEYPNTFALFLLAGILLQMTRGEVRFRDLLLSGVSMCGILLSGSRTAFFLLIICLAVLCLVRRSGRFLLGAGAVLAVVLGLSWLSGYFNIFSSANRYVTTSAQDSTFLVRLLYYKDALGVILRHPFGLGFMGYANLQGSFQTGVYSVTYVHNELLQLLMDVGWIPVGVLIFALCKAFFPKGIPCRNRLLMFAILGHCMLDFDLQFLSIWFLLVVLLDFHGTGEKCRKLRGRPLPVLASLGLVLCLWLGVGDFCYSFGWTHACLKVVPFHTMSMLRLLPEETDTAVLNKTADRILELNPHLSLAYSAKANADYASGSILSMMEHKKLAIENNPYALEEYLDYFDKLWTAMELYRQQGDTVSARICAQEILGIPEMLEQQKQETASLAYKIQHKPELDLPQEYILKLQQLQS